MELRSDVCLFLILLLRYCAAEGHFQNVAYRKLCSQSSYYNTIHRHWCDAAINGNTSGSYNNGPNCIHTGLHDWNPYWQVDLGQSYQIHHIVVWGRTESDTLTRMSRCEIKVDGNLCYTFGSVPVYYNQNFDITCNPPRSGRVIRVEKNMWGPRWSDDFLINMCEFQVYVCSDGYWGSECDTACGQCSSGQVCNKQTGDCPVNGQWGSWSYYACSVSCGGGSQPRRRSCDNPAPRNGGDYCTGNNTETVPCNIAACPVDGEWGSWQSWGTCSKTCGGGSQSRSRQCDNPRPAFGGADCPGASTDTAQCNADDCPLVNGEWGTWWSWGNCSKTCGGGSQSRSRQCDNPAPANGGAACPGNDTEAIPCNTAACPPVDGQWGSWGLWWTCSKTCGGGSQSRSRQCDNPAPANGGADCPGNDTEAIPCNTAACQVVVVEPQLAVPVAVIAAAAVGGVVVTAAIAAVIFFNFVRRRGRSTHDAPRRGTDVDGYVNMSSSKSPEMETTTDDNYEDVSGVGTVRPSDRQDGSCTNPDSAAADSSSTATSSATATATATASGAAVYQNVGDDATANYERLDVSTVGQTSVYTILKKPKK